MLRLPAVSGRFYPAEPARLTSQVREFTALSAQKTRRPVRACLVPHAGYMYSGHVAGAVFSRIALPNKIIILGVRHAPHGEPAAILSEGEWRTPLGDVPIDAGLAEAIRKACPILKNDSVAHAAEHSLEVQLPFLQVLHPGFSFVPIALGTIHFPTLVNLGEALGRILQNEGKDVLLLTTSDLNHYEDDATTRRKDAKAVEQLLALDAKGLYDVCRCEEISMCGLGPAVTMITALNTINETHSELVKYATSADVSGDVATVVGYAGMIFG
ncbi:MAG TPA: AmmeMemoRadiSam system protein B [Candidatus Acidoferrum sp.]|nr:AmmeMemoRadiSam system protein B [Candidatus Acidoferrum sp.]